MLIPGIEEAANYHLEANDSPYLLHPLNYDAITPQSWQYLLLNISCSFIGSLPNPTNSLDNGLAGRNNFKFIIKNKIKSQK